MLHKLTPEERAKANAEDMVSSHYLSNEEELRGNYLVFKDRILEDQITVTKIPKNKTQYKVIVPVLRDKHHETYECIVRVKEGQTSKGLSCKKIL